MQLRSAESIREASGYVIHPALLDGVMQSIGCMSSGSGSFGGTPVPSSVERVVLVEQNEGGGVMTGVVGHSRIVEVDEGRKVIADIVVYAEGSGEVVAVLDGFEFLIVGGGSGLESEFGEWYEWKEVELSSVNGVSGGDETVTEVHVVGCGKGVIEGVGEGVRV